MKSNWLLGLLVLAVVPVSAETVSSVSFNPSRLGNYQVLRVSGAATLRGGLQTTDLEIKSKPLNEVCMTDSSGAIIYDEVQQLDDNGNAILDESGNPVYVRVCRVDSAQSDPGGTVTFNGPSSGQTYAVGSLAGEGASVFNISNAFVRGSGGTSSTYAISQNAWVSQSDIFPLTVKGGSVSMTGGDSYIGTLTANNNLFQYAKSLTVDGTLSITGALSDGNYTSVPLLNSAGDESASTTGFKLGSINIPSPKSAVYRPTTAQDYTAPAELDLSNNNCTLAWTKRPVTLKNASDTPVARWVLGFKNCSPLCSPTAPEQYYRVLPCGRMNGHRYIGIKKALKVRQTICENNEPVEQDCYYNATTKSCYTDEEVASGVMWDTSNCVQMPEYAWEYVEDSKQPNTYESHWIWWDRGWDGLFGHHDGLDDTRCNKLHFGSSFNLFSFLVFDGDGEHQVNLSITQTMQRKNDPVHSSDYRVCDVVGTSSEDDMDAMLNVSICPTMKVEPMPTCNASRVGETRRFEVVAVRPKLAVWPATCRGVGYQKLYKCVKRD